MGSETGEREYSGSQTVVEMDNSSDGSPIAARSAQPKSLFPVTPHQEPLGLVGRFFSAFSTKPKAEALPAKSGAANGRLHASHRPGHVTLIPQLTVNDVSIPRADIVAVQDTIPLAQLVGVFKESGRSRLPVFSESLDNPAGLVHVKDVALGYGFNGTGDKFDLKEMIRPILYVPPSMPIWVLLQKMQAERIHMALVIDEYGGVDGLVTIEDLIEEAFGDIADEHDAVEEESHWVEEAPGVYLCKAKAPLLEFESVIGLNLVEDWPEEEIDTLGGLVFVLAGRVPSRGEVLPHPAGLEMEIVDAEPRRIKSLRVRTDASRRP